MGLIYRIYFQNGKSYIGQTIQPINKRMQQHKTKKDCVALYNAIQKYPNFEYEILLETNNCMLDYYEILFINLFNSIIPNGYNIRSGGSSGLFTEITKEKMRKSHIGKIQEDSTKIKISNALSGVSKKLEHKEKVSNTKKQNSNAINRFHKILPMYMHHKKDSKKMGFSVSVPGFHTKCFTSMKISMDEKYELAYNYLNQIVQRLNVNGN